MGYNANLNYRKGSSVNRESKHTHGSHSSANKQVTGSHSNVDVYGSGSIYVDSVGASMSCPAKHGVNGGNIHRHTVPPPPEDIMQVTRCDKASETKLVCAVGSRNGTEITKLLVLDFGENLDNKRISYVYT